jgi:uncharacterized protein YndB with AHSA1/START domain
MGSAADGLLLRIDGTLEAPRERVFGMLTTPRELATWWGPRGFTTPELALDLRVGGAYRFTMQPPGGEPFHVSGEFREIDPPHRLVYTFRWDEPTEDDRETLVTLELRSLDAATELSLSQGPFATEERLALHRNGWTESLERLRDAMSTRSRPSPGPPAP